MVCGCVRAWLDRGAVCRSHCRGVLSLLSVLRWMALLVTLFVLVSLVGGSAGAALQRRLGRADDAQLSVVFSGSGSGTVTSSPAAVSCTASCQASFALGTTVTLTARPAAGSGLDDWPNGLCQEQGAASSYRGSSCTLVLEADEQVSVYFERVTLKLLAPGSGAGMVTSSPAGIPFRSSCQASFALRATVTLTARPAAGSALDDWPKGQCQEQGGAASYGGSTCTLVLEA